MTEDVKDDKMPQTLDERIKRLAAEHDGMMQEEFFVRDYLKDFKEKFYDGEVYPDDATHEDEERHIEVTVLLNAILAVKEEMNGTIVQLNDERTEELIAGLQNKYVDNE